MTEYNLFYYSYASFTNAQLLPAERAVALRCLAGDEDLRRLRLHGRAPMDSELRANMKGV